VPGYVVAEGAVESSELTGDTAETRVTIDSACGCERLEQRVTRFRPGRSRARTLAGTQEVMYVASGRGSLLVDGRAYGLEPGTAAYVSAGESYSVESSRPEPVVVVSAVAPHVAGAADPARRTVRYADRPPLPAGSDREFRVLVNEELGCLDVTQFVGLIPPGRAPLHSHAYDEVVYVLEGEGVLHLGERETRISGGSCIHLPPLLMHCLENTGPTPMRVLGVFHPSGDPASRAAEQT
jgi:mannose-6-phosphate isomerase-like protein (cupin superfamily)